MATDHKHVVRLPQTQRRQVRTWAQQATSSNRALVFLAITRSPQRRRQVDVALSADLGGGQIVTTEIHPGENPWNQILATRGPLQEASDPMQVIVSVDADQLDDATLRALDVRGEHLDHQRIRLLLWATPETTARIEQNAPDLYRSGPVSFLAVEDLHSEPPPRPWAVQLDEEIRQLDQRIESMRLPGGKVMLQGMRIAACLEAGDYDAVQLWFKTPQIPIAFEAALAQTLLPDLALPDWMGFAAPATIHPPESVLPDGDETADPSLDAAFLRIAFRRGHIEDAFRRFNTISSSMTCLHDALLCLEVGRVDDFDRHLQEFHWNHPDYPEDWKALLRIGYRFQVDAERQRRLGRPKEALQQELVSFYARRSMSAWGTLEGNVERIIRDCWALGIQGDAVALVDDVLEAIGPAPSLRRARFLYLSALAYGWRSPLRATQLLGEAVETFRIPTETVPTLEQPFAWLDIGRYEHLRSAYEDPETVRTCLERAALSFRHAGTGAEGQGNEDAAQWARVSEVSVLVAMHSWDRAQTILREAIDWSLKHEGPARVSERWLDLVELALAKNDLDLAAGAAVEARQALDQSDTDHLPVSTEVRMARVGHRVDVANQRVDLALERLQAATRRVRGTGLKAPLMPLLHTIAELGPDAPPSVREDAALEASDTARDVGLVYDEARAIANLAALHPGRGRSLIEEATDLVADLHGGALAQHIRAVATALKVDFEMP